MVVFLFLQTQTFATTTAKENMMYSFLSFDYRGEKIFIGLQVESEQKVQQIKQGVKGLLARNSQLWFSWQEKNYLANQINQSLTRSEAMVLPKYILSYIKKLQSLALQSQHFYNPTLKRLLTLPKKLKLNNKKLNFAEIEFFDDAIFSNNNNLQLDLEVGHVGYLMQKIQELLERVKVQEASIEHRQHILFLGKSKSPQIIPDSDLESVDLCDGESLSIRQGTPKKIAWQRQEYYMADLTQDFQQAQSKIVVIHSDPIVADTASYAILGAGADWQKAADLLEIDQFMVISKSKKYISPMLRYKQRDLSYCHKL